MKSAVFDTLSDSLRNSPLHRATRHGCLPGFTDRSESLKLSSKLDQGMWPRALLIAAGVGAVYGLIGLEAVSPLAIPLALWAIGILLLAWRLPADLRTVTGAAVGFVYGFGIVWTVALGNLLASCKPPSCATAGPTTDVLYALVLIAPMIALAGAEIGVREWLVAHRSRTRH